MSKLKRIISQLSDNELKVIHNSLVESEAHKSAELLKLFRENQLKDFEIKDRLEVNNNAFYTLRSRLNEKIETFFLQQMESPRTTLLKQVASINEIILTKKRTIAIATLKKLEKELIDYDLSNELIIVYKALKKLHVHSPDYYEYSQKYNKHVAYMLAVDKAEDHLLNYFKLYNIRLLNYNEDNSLNLELTAKELQSISDLYKSHRLFVFKSCQEYFTELFINENSHSIEYFDAMDKKVDKIFNTYNLDTTYHNLRWVFEYLCLLKAHKYRNYHFVDRQLEKLNEVADHLLTNYSSFTCPIYFLHIKIERYLALGMTKELYTESIDLFKSFDIDVEDSATYVHYILYRALAAYFTGHYVEAIDHLEELLEDVSLKGYNDIQVDIKLMLVLFYIKNLDIDKSTFLLNNVQRHIRMMGKEQCEHSYSLMKVLKSALAVLEIQKKERKIDNYVKKFNQIEKPIFSPLKFLKLDLYDFNLDQLNFYEEE